MRLEATTIDIVYTGGRLNVNYNFACWIFIIGSWYYIFACFCIPFSSLCSLFTIQFFRILTRIVCSKAATHQVLNDDGLTGIFFLDIDGNYATDAASSVVAAIDILKDTAGNCHSEVSTDIRVIGTTTDVFNIRILCSTAGNDDIHITF